MPSTCVLVSALLFTMHSYQLGQLLAILGSSCSHSENSVENDLRLYSSIAQLCLGEARICLCA